MKENLFWIVPTVLGVIAVAFVFVAVKYQNEFIEEKRQENNIIILECVEKTNDLEWCIDKFN